MILEESLNPVASVALPQTSLPGKLAAIFSHRWHFILKDSQEWRTETAYPIKPAVLWSMWQDAQVFIGVRFGALTRYGLIDIDIDSPYHPNQDPTAISGIIWALESIGIYRVLIVRSSLSQGIHLYIPLETPIATYGLATALKLCCEAAGFNLSPGQLEIFPNCKAYRPGGHTNYNGHRLPLQSGSFLLDSDYQPISNDLGFFFSSWDIAARGNDHHELEVTIAANKKRPCTYTRGQNKGEKWKADCEAAIATGWTAHGQTNELLGTFAQYGRVFLSLSGEELVQWLIGTVIDAPGYRSWCRHQHHIDRRCREWARESESYYFPYPTLLSRSRKPWGHSDANDQKSASAIERIKTAYDLVRKIAYKTTTDLAQAIASIAKCSLSTLYKNLTLWQTSKGEEVRGCVIAETLDRELVSPDPQLNTSKTLKPLPTGLLHTRSYKKVLNPAGSLERDRNPEKMISTSKISVVESPKTAFAFNFGDRSTLKIEARSPEVFSRMESRPFWGVYLSLEIKPP